MNVDDIYQLIEETSSLLRGMMFDPAIPGHTKMAMQSKIQELEAALEKLEPELYN